MKNITIIGAGPSGLIAAEFLAVAGYKVTIYDQVKTVGRKFLLAGRGGLNLSNQEDLENFINRYGDATNNLKTCINDFPPEKLVKWCNDLGQPTFIGSSKRIFPVAMKTAPLLRAWLKRLNDLGVNFQMNHRFIGFDNSLLKNNLLKFENSDKQIITTEQEATILALGGASWAKLGSDGKWVAILQKENIVINPLKPTNCGFLVNWSDYFISKFKGQAIKPLAITHQNISLQGEALISDNGIEGGLIYSFSSLLRKYIEKNNNAVVYLDLRPQISIKQLEQKLADVNKSSKSTSTYLRKIGLSPLTIALLREGNNSQDLSKMNSLELAKLIKNLPIKLIGIADIDKAISTSGGVKFSELDDNFMLKNHAGVFIAGEMLDWEAPTGGYLLQACFATGVMAAKGVINYTTKIS